MSGTHTTRCLAISGVLGICLSSAFIESAFSQPRTRTDRNSLLYVLSSDRTAADLELTDDLKKQVRDLAGKANFTRDQYQPFTDRMRKSKTETERAKIREEMTAAASKHRKDVENQALALLNDSQRDQLFVIRVRNAGGLRRALTIDTLETKLALTAEQQKSIEESLKSRGEAWSKVSPADQFRKEAQEKFSSEWDGKLLAVLTPAQQDLWKKLSLPADADPKTPAGKTVAKPTPVQPVGPIVTRPVGEYKASFAPSKPSERSVAVNYGASGVSAQGSGAPARSGEEMLSFNFENAPWKIVLEFFAKKAGLSLDMLQVPPDTFNYRDPTLYTVTQALDVLNGYMIPKSFIMVRRDRFLVVHNLANPVPESIIPDVSILELPRRGRNELMRVTFTINPDVKVQDVAKELEDLQGAYGKVVAIDSAKRLVVTDIGSNLMRIERILRDVTKPEDLQKPSFRAFKLMHIAATDAEKIVTELLNASKNTRNVSASSGADSNDPRARFMQMMQSRTQGGGRTRGGSGGGSPFGGGSTRGATNGSSTRTTGNTNIKVTAEPRTNSLFVTASAEQIKLAEEIVKALDVPLEGESQLLTNRNNENVPFLKVYRVYKADAREVTKTLSALIPDVVINEDGKNGTIHIFATPAEHRMVEELIREMDGGGAGGQVMDVVSVLRHDPVAVATTLNAMFQSERDSAPSIQANTAGRQLLVKGTKTQVEQIKTFVSKLEDSAPVASSGPIGNVITIPIPGDEAQFLKTLELMWKGTSPGNPIRIIMPGDQNPIRERVTPSGERIQPEGTRPATKRNGFQPPATTTEQPRRGFTPTTPVRTTRRLPAARQELLALYTPQPDGLPLRDVTNGSKGESQPTDGGESLTSQPLREGVQPKAAVPTGKPISVMVRDGQLIIASDDKEALGRMHRLIETLLQNSQNKASWTVFYLQAADCEDAARMLESLFPSSSVSNTSAGSSGLLGGLTGGINSFGNTLMDVSGLNSLGAADTLRIIPDVRSNSLFVSGPASKIRDVERVLKVLDASDLPSTLRDRMPRMIPVRYADVNEVAENVRELYKDFMQPAGGTNSRNGANPLAMLMGGNTGGSRSGRGSRGGSNGGGSQRAQQVQLTLSVDNRTGQLIVSANDTLYNQIEEIVYNLDKSAYEAQRTTRVIHLENASAAVISQTLTAMYPNVSVSATSSTPGRTSGSSQQQPNSGFGGSQSDDAARAERIQRFMQFQQQQGGQGGNPGAGGGRFGGGNTGGGRFGGGNTGGSRFGGGNTGGGNTGGGRTGGRRGGR